jgi:acyl-[acyl-carrier-protein]-phospholipid O-acyltransferase/long-chain-fatty-acid--[acyl-carrier-protein] ligase
MWLPLIKGIPIVTIPSPLEINKTIAAIQAEQVSILLGTPTFLRGYLKKGSSNKFKSLQYVVAGAEKSNIDFIKQWETIADCKYLEGYGLTETSPVISLNTTTNGIKHGSVGRMLPSIKVKTIHPETKVDLSRTQSGLLCFQGDNIFTEYIMDSSKTKSAFENGWFVTGDIGKLDSDGFLFIEGRLSRFSKIGGEMIPHETIEAEAIKILDWQHDDQIKLVIVGIPHDRKGEELYLITTENINFTNLRSELSKQLGNLFVPKKHKIVNEIPVLATGKLDLQTLKELVY